MKIDTTKDVWVDVSGLPHKKNVGVLWAKSIGMQVPFKYYETNGVFDIIDYNKDTHLLTVILKDKEPLVILTDGFLGCKFIKYIGYHKTNWKYNIGDRLCNNKRDITITNRKENYDNGKHYKFYQYKCNKCGFNCGEHYRDQVYQEDLWVLENKLNQSMGCTCCHNKVVVSGINDIPTTAPWMINYFQGSYDEAKMYTKTSNRRIYPICPDCGNVSKKNNSINDLYNKKLSCICSDQHSYPNKFAYGLFMQLPVTNWCREYSPEWAKPYRYDVYFELKGKMYIVEMDGLLGHGEYMYKSGKKDVEGLKRDEIKNKLAIDNNIHIIRIDCKKSNMDYIKNNILKSDLYSLFDLSNINWTECDKFATNNLIKELCEYWKNNDYPIYDEVALVYHLPKITVRKYLKKGGEFGWCDYETHKRDKNKKIINVYNEKDEYIGRFLGIVDFCNNSMEICGVHFDACNITLAIKNNRRYNGYRFEEGVE